MCGCGKFIYYPQQIIPYMRLPALCLLFTLYAHFAIAQDVITRTNGEKINAKVLKVTSTEIEYKLFDNQDGPLHTLLRSDVNVIIYQNGTKDVFSDMPVDGNDSHLSYRERGILDAKTYYKSQMGGAIVSGAILGYGTIPAIIMYCTPPRYEMLNFPSRELMENHEYNDAYVRKAGQIKRSRTAGGFAIGTGISISVIAAASIALMTR